jgi:hypothetical protein
MVGGKGMRTSNNAYGIEHHLLKLLELHPSDCRLARLSADVIAAEDQFNGWYLAEVKPKSTAGNYNYMMQILERYEQILAEGISAVDQYRADKNFELLETSLKTAAGKMLGCANETQDT